MSSSQVVIGNGKYDHSTIYEGCPIHLLHRGSRVSRKEGENKCEYQERDAEPVQKESNGSREGEFGGEEW